MVPVGDVTTIAAGRRSVAMLVAASARYALSCGVPGGASERKNRRPPCGTDVMTIESKAMAAVLAVRIDLSSRSIMIGATRARRNPTPTNAADGSTGDG